MREDLYDQRRLLDGGDDPELPATLRAVFQVELEHALEQPCPAHARLSAVRVLARGHADTLRRARHDCRTQPGAYTAFGDCTPLLAATDDAVAIFGAGEEVRLRFNAARAPAAVPGSGRCWVLEVDGWCKDMDLLTGEGAELGPLPLRDGRATTPERDALHARFNVRWAGGR